MAPLWRFHESGGALCLAYICIYHSVLGTGDEVKANHICSVNTFIYEECIMVSVNDIFRNHQNVKLKLVIKYD